MKLRGPSIAAFLQQAEANLALLSAQLQDGRLAGTASGRRRVRRCVTRSSPENSEEDIEESEVRDQLSVQARTMLSLERRLKVLETAPRGDVGSHWEEELRKATENISKDLMCDLQSRLDLAEQRLRRYCDDQLAALAQAVSKAPLPGATDDLSQAAETAQSADSEHLEPKRDAKVLGPTAVGFQDPAALRSSPRSQRSPSKTSSPAGPSNMPLFMPETASNPSGSPSSLYRRRNSSELDLNLETSRSDRGPEPESQASLPPDQEEATSEPCEELLSIQGDDCGGSSVMERPAEGATSNAVLEKALGFEVTPQASEKSEDQVDDPWENVLDVLTGPSTKAVVEPISPEQRQPKDESDASEPDQAGNAALPVLPQQVEETNQDTLELGWTDTMAPTSTTSERPFVPSSGLEEVLGSQEVELGPEDQAESIQEIAEEFQRVSTSSSEESSKEPSAILQVEELPDASEDKAESIQEIALTEDFQSDLREQPLEVEEPQDSSDKAESIQEIALTEDFPLPTVRSEPSAIEMNEAEALQPVVGNFDTLVEATSEEKALQPVVGNFDTLVEATSEEKALQPVVGNFDTLVEATSEEKALEPVVGNFDALGEATSEEKALGLSVDTPRSSEEKELPSQACLTTEKVSKANLTPEDSDASSEGKAKAQVEVTTSAVSAAPVAGADSASSDSYSEYESYEEESSEEEVPASSRPVVDRNNAGIVLADMDSSSSSESRVRATRPLDTE